MDKKEKRDAEKAGAYHLLQKIRHASQDGYAPEIVEESYKKLLDEYNTDK